MERPKTHRRWRCPKCPNRFTNPVGLVAVACPRREHKVGTRIIKEPVSMVPEEEADE